jgi:predicted nuclease of predicted toxin-antitoxin system
MRAKLDENLPVGAVHLFQEHGWECHTVADEDLVGAADSRIADACRRERRVLFTLDLDFADIRAYPPAEHVGIVVLRPPVPSRGAVLNLLSRALPVLREHWQEHLLWIAEPSRVRVRGTDEPTV